MYVLNYWHTVSDYAEWKKLFDSDPLGREASGVRSYVIEHPLEDESTVVGHLQFDSLAEAEAFADRLDEMWNGSAGRIVSGAGHLISEVLEQKRLGGEASRRAA